MSTAPFHYVHALDGVPDDSPERVEMHRHEYVDPGTVYLSIHDDSDERITFYADQIDSLIDALIACKKYREGIEAGERRNVTDAANSSDDINFKSDRLKLSREAKNIEVEEMPIDEELILSGLVINSRKNRGES